MTGIGGGSGREPLPPFVCQACFVPLVIGLIFLLLFFTFRNLRQAALILLAIPFSMVGGLLALMLGRLYLSVPASVGFIALFGVAVLNGVVKIAYINQLRGQGMPLDEAVLTGMVLRLRIVLMTAVVAMMALIPLLLATGPGSEIQRPLHGRDRRVVFINSLDPGGDARIVSMDGTTNCSTSGNGLL